MKTVKKKSKNHKTLSTLETRESESNRISEEMKKAHFIKQPYYNFIYAEEELGLNFLDLSKNGFREFLETIYLNDLIQLRKAYIKRDYGTIRFLSHKFISPFALIGASDIRDASEVLQAAIDKGKIDIEEEYKKFLFKTSEFLHELYQFCINVNIYLNLLAIRAFIRENDKCNMFEDPRIKSYLSLSPRRSSQIRDSQIIIQDFRIHKECCKCMII